MNDWYSVDEARKLLERTEDVNPPWLAQHLNLAYHKGRQIGHGEAEIERTEMKALAQLREIRDKLASIVCTEGCDKGVVMLSDDGPCHYDAALKCQVYDHDYFSPLGDALIEVWELACGVAPVVPGPPNPPRPEQRREFA